MLEWLRLASDNWPPGRPVGAPPVTSGAKSWPGPARGVARLFFALHWTQIELCAARLFKFQHTHTQTGPAGDGSKCGQRTEGATFDRKLRGQRDGPIIDCASWRIQMHASGIACATLISYSSLAQLPPPPPPLTRRVGIVRAGRQTVTLVGISPACGSRAEARIYIEHHCLCEIFYENLEPQRDEWEINLNYTTKVEQREESKRKRRARDTRGRGGQAERTKASYENESCVQSDKRLAHNGIRSACAHVRRKLARKPPA